MTSRTIWITGARGFIGRHLARQLHAAGHAVAGIGHGGWPDASGWGVTAWINGEPRSENLSQLAAATGRPDAIFNLAGGASVGAALAAPREDFARTVETAANLLEWTRLAAPEARIVAVSSAAVYGEGSAGPIGEAATTQPCSPYGAHKLMMEQLCRSYAATFGTRLIILRLFSVYGSHLRKQLLWDICTRLAAGETELLLGGHGGELRDWIEISDVVAAMQVAVDAADQSAPVLNVGTGLGTSVADIAGHVCDAWGKGAGVRFSGVARAGDPQSLVADISRLSELGFQAGTSVDHGIAAYVRWFRDQSEHPQ